MAKGDKLSEEIKKDFCELIDEAILGSGEDKELMEGFRTLDELAKGMRVSFYDLLLELYEKEEIEMRVNLWKKEKDIKDNNTK